MIISDETLLDRLRSRLSVGAQLAVDTFQDI